MKHAVIVQPEPRYQEKRLTRRLKNWGDWLKHDALVGPKHVVCVSIESRHVAEIGDTTEEDRTTAPPIPDVDDAKEMQKLIDGLAPIERYVLDVNYGGFPCVMRFRRVGDFAERRALENAHTRLQEMIKKH